VAKRLDEYRRRRDPGRTPEPVPPTAAGDPAGPPTGRDDTFVVQEHHASRLHWDVRLERHGVLVSWAVPRGLPRYPDRQHLAVHTEDHPLEYATFAGEIPTGEYGGGTVTSWDAGTYELEKWTDREVAVVLHGERVSGRYVFIRTGHGDDRDWLVRRRDPPTDPTARPLPDLVRPMLAAAGGLPSVDDDDRWGYEMKWDGVRAMLYVSGGRVRVLSRSDRDVTAAYPELQGLGADLGSTECILDGEVVAFDDDGRVSFAALQPRMHVADPAVARRLATQRPISFLAFDLLHLEGHPALKVPYGDRRRLLEDLELAGDQWRTPPAFSGAGADALAASRSLGLEGVVAKRLDSPYRPGARSRDWIKIKHVRAQSVVIGGWSPGQGRRVGVLGSLLIGVPDGDHRLRYAGHVGTGFTHAALTELTARLRTLERPTAPFADPIPSRHAKGAHWVEPLLVGEVVFAEWTRDDIVRAPSWRGLRPDLEPDDVVRED
jgi:bifunctional non-homologous end joining protein LigD